MTTGTSTRMRARLEKRLGKRFTFICELGHGASGLVFEVTNRKLERKEALKVLTETPEGDFLERFTQEAKVSASLDHPRIVKVYEFGQAGDYCWYSMQYVNGASLAELLEVHGPLDESGLARLAIPLLDALHYSHRQGVVHRDIKPANILICDKGRPYIMDFGIAKTLDSVHKTRTGLLLGTPAYVSPEQALAHPVDARSDIYSFGVTLYQAATGELPFLGDASLQTVVMRLKEPPRPILEPRPGLNPTFAAIIMKALEREKEARWTSADEMRAAFIAAAEQAGLSWNSAMDGLPDLAQVRKVLYPTDGTVVALGKEWRSREESTDRGLLRRYGLWAAVALAAFGIAGVLVKRSAAPSVAVASTPPPVLPSPVLPPPAATPQPVPPPPRKTAQVPVPPPKASAPLPGRPVTPPLLESSAAPDAASVSGCKGLTVTLSLKIAPDGTVLTAKVLSPAPPDCARAARDAGMRHRFRPATDAEGRPVEATVAIAVVFPEAP